MSTLSLRLPNSLHVHAKRLAQEEGVSINQLISTAVSEKIAALDTEKLLTQRAAKGSKGKFMAVMKKAGNRKPQKGDEL